MHHSAYGSYKGRHAFTQPQLMTCLVLRAYGPGNDKTHARGLMDKASVSVTPDILYADPGYGAEWVHRYCHEDWGVMPMIKPVKHKEGPPGGEYRSLMTDKTLK